MPLWMAWAIPQVSEGQASDLEGADVLLADLEAEVVIADKGYYADERVVEPLQAKGVTGVIPPRRNRFVHRKREHRTLLKEVSDIIKNV